MNLKEGLIPALLGTVVTATGATIAMKSKKIDKVGWGLVGAGIAHIALGTIDLVEHR